MPRYWVDNLRRTVRFAAAVQAAMEDGYRVFAELAPHPLLTHPLEQNARSLDMPLAALASMRREQELPHGLRGFVADLHSAGAAVDFSVLYPNGRLVDAPLPTWTHRQLRLSRDGQDTRQRTAARTISVHPLLGAHVRLQEEPERHVWQGEVGTADQPWLGDHQIRNVAVLPGAAYCEMALAAAHAVLGEASEVRDIRFEQALLLDEQTTDRRLGVVVVAGRPRLHRGDELRAANKRGKLRAVLHAAEDEQPPAHDTSALLAAHPTREDGDEVRERMDQRGVQYGPAFAGLGAVHTGGTAPPVLAEVALPRQIRSQQAAYGVHPALLDACFQSVEAHPDVQALGEGVLGLPLGIRRLRSYAAARNAHYCYTRVTKADPSGVEADIDVLDEHGAVLLAVRGLAIGHRSLRRGPTRIGFWPSGC